MPSFAMPQTAADPLQMAKLKLSEGKPLTSEEARLVAPVPMSETRKGRGLTGSPSPKMASLATLNAIPADKPKMPIDVGSLAGGSFEGLPRDIPTAPSDTGVDVVTGASPMPQLGKIATAKAATPVAKPVAIAPKPIQPVNAPGPDPVVSSAVQQAAASSGNPEIVQAAETKLNEPLPPEKAAKALNAFQQFLAKNPDGLTLANILDAVGVSLSAYGGTQRKTMLQGQKEAEMALAQQMAATQQGQEFSQESQAREFAQQNALKQQDLENQLASYDKQLAIAQAQGQTDLANRIAQDKARVEAELYAKKQEIQAQTEAERSLIAPKTEAQRSLLGPQAVAQAGGVQGLAKNWISGVNN